MRYHAIAPKKLAIAPAHSAIAAIALAIAGRCGIAKDLQKHSQTTKADKSPKNANKQPKMHRGTLIVYLFDFS